MKKYAAGLAMLAAVAQLAHAESGVTVSGTIDGGIRYQNNANPAGGSLTSIGTNGWNSSNKLDFIGNEDLGDGSRVGFVLEAGFNDGTGALDNTTGTLFQRQAFIQYEGRWGALSLGRQYTISHDFILSYDPFGFRYTPLLPLTRASSGTRFNNDLKYVKRFGPIRLELENAFGEVAGNAHNGAAHGVGLQYEAGELTFGGSVNRRSILVGTTYHDDNYWLVGAAWVHGPLKISGGTMLDRVVNVAPALDARTRDSFGGVNYQLDATWNITAGHYITDATADKAQRRNMTIVGIEYALSKRTKLYFEADHQRFRNAIVSTVNTAGVGSVNALTTGINHRF